jgi:hypothetical protein
MKRKSRSEAWMLLPLVVALMPGLTGCAPKEAEPGAGSPAASSPAAPASNSAGGNSSASSMGTHPGTDEGAKALLNEFVQPGADHAALTKNLRPTKADLEAIFTADLAGKADAVYGPAWDSGQLVVAPKPGQTEVKIASATSEEIKKGTGAAADLPGGWKQVADKLKPGLRLYQFKFVEPGKDSGMAYDGLVHVNGNWRIAPKPWRAL